MGLLIDSGIVWPRYDNLITDWLLGNDREWAGSLALRLLPSGDVGLSDVYLTIKLSPLDSDAQALMQIHVTETNSVYGAIVNSPALTNVSLRILGGQLVGSGALAGPVYSYDIRGFGKTSGAIWTFETGQIMFEQNVTAMVSSGLPAALPNMGNPVFRGFAYGPPVIGIYNVGDYFRNAGPAPGEPSGWVCIAQGSPGTWVSDGIVGDTTGA